MGQFGLFPHAYKVHYFGLFTMTAGSANAKGSYLQVTASTPFDGYAVGRVVSGGGSALTDLAVGAAGSEKVLIPNMSFVAPVLSDGWNNFHHPGILCPYIVPAGSRLAVRVQSSSGSSANYVAVFLVSGPGFIGPKFSMDKIVDYGAVTATSKGTTVDPGASADTKGAWAELTASSSHDILAFYLSTVTMGTWISSGTSARLDIGVGAAGSEVIVVADLPWFGYNGLMSYTPITPMLFVQIPAGSRIAVRAKASSNVYRELGVILHGMS